MAFEVGAWNRSRLRLRQGPLHISVAKGQAEINLNNRHNRSLEMPQISMRAQTDDDASNSFGEE